MFKRRMQKSFPTPEGSFFNFSTGTEPAPNVGHTCLPWPYFERLFLPNIPLSLGKQTPNTILGTIPASAMRVGSVAKHSMASLSLWETLSDLCLLGGVSPGKQEGFMDLDRGQGKTPMKCHCH